MFMAKDYSLIFSTKNGVHNGRNHENVNVLSDFDIMISSSSCLSSENQLQQKQASSVICL